jgi:hypothetical protein
MHRIEMLTVVVIALIVTAAAPAAAQITMINADAARAAFRVGFGGRGIDLDGSIDSPLLAGIVRVRGSVGQGRWVGLGEVPPPAGASPRVVRAAASALLFIPMSPGSDAISSYVGLGVAAYSPLGVDLRRQIGRRVTWGIEGPMGDRWTMGVEVEADLPDPHNDRTFGSVGDHLIPAVRMGIAFRRQF